MAWARMARGGILAASLVVGFGGCFKSTSPQGGRSPPSSLDTGGHVHMRAASDFGCPEPEVTVRFVGGGGYRAAGCGRSATYVCEDGRGRGFMHGAPACRRDGDVQGSPTGAGRGCARQEDCAAGEICHPTRHACESVDRVATLDQFVRAVTVSCVGRVESRSSGV